MFVGAPRWPSCMPTETARTVAAPRSRAARVGTGATRPPSARHRVPISTGSNKPGKAQLARMASTRLPCVNTTGSPEFRSVATTARGMRRSSNRRDSKTRSIKFPRRWLLAKPSRETRHRAKIAARILGSTFLLVRCPLCTIVNGNALRDSLSRQAESLRGSRTMDAEFKAWIGQPVVLQVALGNVKVPLRGKLLKDGSDTIRMRIGEGWDVDIYKAMILAVEADSMVMLPA